MRRGWGVLGIVVLVTALPMSAVSGAESRRAGEPGRPYSASAAPARVELVGVSMSGGAMHRDDFSVVTLRHLRIRVWWNVAGGEVQHLELVSPDGAIYQRLEAPLEARGRSRQSVVETVVPVAGTWMTQHSLFGLWTVNVYLDNDQAPIASASFSLNP